MKPVFVLGLILILFTTLASAAPIHDAARSGQLERMRQLINQGSAVNTPHLFRLYTRYCWLN